MKSSRLSRLVFALLVSGVAVGLPPALAAELPADTNTIESLTPEQATTLNSAALVTKLTQRNDALLWISRLTAVSPEAAEVLAGIDKWDGRLPSLTTLDSPDSVEIAKALATRKQRLSLPNLEKISPKTLSALLEKRDVEIPLVETLELLPEPDGSLTEDFIIPEWLEARERQQRAAQATE
ncbi:MAG: hypothetical protein LW698_09335 [Planctomycetaceae bacterium]|jgi:hypothetical protein|nr:hypothetical protein [Planctomycetaceae bacterium]